MKAKKDVRKPEAISIYSDQDGKPKKGVDKPFKNQKRTLFEEIEEDEELGLMEFRKKESILDYLEEVDGDYEGEEDDDEYDNEDNEEDYEYEDDEEEVN